MEKLTIFTPTFNRKKTIIKTYESLINQSNKKFIWLIVDDGSTDNTQELVKNWQKENKINIQYYYKKNGGKHTAYNFAMNYLKTEYVYISLDSDDILYNSETINSIYQLIDTIPKNYGGCVTLCTDSYLETNTLKKKYDVNVLNNKSLKWACENNKFNAESRFIFKTNYIKKYIYPVIEGERFFTEAYVYYRLDKPLIWSDINTCYSKYLNDGLTSNSKKLFINNPNSWYLYNKMRKNCNKSIFMKIKYNIYYICFALMSKKPIFNENLFQNILNILLFIPGYLGFIYFRKVTE